MTRQKRPFTTTRHLKFSFLVGKDVEKDQWTDYESDGGTFSICAVKGENVYGFWVHPKPLYAQSYWVKSLDGSLLSSGKISPELESTKYTNIATIVTESLPVMDGSCEVEICLSADEPSELEPKRPHTEAMMAKLYEDTTYQDVSFAFGEASAGEESVFSRVVEIGAHKHILAQWPYFKAMFESGFVESEPDAKQIRIKDVKPAAFKRAIQFMYMGDLAKEDRPATIFSDALEDEECVSWEDIYVTAHRYDLEDLCHLAKKKIMAGLTKENSVPFLFRSAHFYDDLREPVVKYVASSCVSVITTEDFRSKYLDHPEAAALLYQLFTEQCRAIQPDVAMASK